VLAPHGTACLVGSAGAGVEVHLEMRTLQQGRSVRGCVQGDSEVQTFLPRQLPIERLVRHYPHAAINDAVADMLAGTTIKAVLQIGTA
jgi:aryl-alcohol dehydrogenase